MTFARLLLIFTLACFASSASAALHIQHWQTAAGAKVYFVENHDLPMLDVSVEFAAGNAFDDTSKNGVAEFTSSLLDAGSQGLSEDDIGRELAEIGAEKSAFMDNDRAGISLRTLSNPAERDKALEILAQMLQHPLFPDAILAREKARTVATLKEAESKPESIADKAFGKAVFGTHPYGRSLEISDVEKIHRADLENFYRSHYGAKGAVVALMGDISRAEAEKIALQLTTNLPPSGTSSSIASVAPLTQASEQRIPHPATQSHILIGAPGIARNDPDYFPLFVGNYVLGGGGFVSRLMNEIREKRGMAYSVYSYFMPMQQAGAFQIGLQTRKDQADEALQLARSTLRDFVSKGVTEKELQAAKDNIIGGFPLRIDSNRKIIEYLGMIGFYDLPLTYLDEFTARVEKVSAQQIHDAFVRHIHPDAMATIIVGAPQEKTEPKS